MNLQMTGHHVEITASMRGYVTDKLARVTRHFDQVLDVNVILSVEKLEQRAEVTVHVSGRDFFVESIDEDMYAAIDLLADKLDRQILRHKEKQANHHNQETIRHKIVE
jgi:putative sigma-54 modulation protein